MPGTGANGVQRRIIVKAKIGQVRDLARRAGVGVILRLELEPMTQVPSYQHTWVDFEINPCGGYRVRWPDGFVQHPEDGPWREPRYARLPGSYLMWIESFFRIRSSNLGAVLRLLSRKVWRGGPQLVRRGLSYRLEYYKKYRVLSNTRY